MRRERILKEIEEEEQEISRELRRSEIRYLRGTARQDYLRKPKIMYDSDKKGISKQEMKRTILELIRTNEHVWIQIAMKSEDERNHLFVTINGKEKGTGVEKKEEEMGSNLLTRGRIHFEKRDLFQVARRRNRSIPTHEEINIQFYMFLESKRFATIFGSLFISELEVLEEIMLCINQETVELQRCSQEKHVFDLERILILARSESD